MLRASRALAAVLVALAAALTLAAQASAAPAVAGEFSMPGASELGSDNEIVAGSDGNMWVTTSAVNGVARFTPEGVGTFFPLDVTAYGITLGPDGNLWVSQELGVAKIPPGNPAAAEEITITGFAGGRGVTVGPDGNIWVLGTNKLVRINPANPTVDQDINPITTANAKGMTTASDGLLWYADGDKIVSATATDTPVLTPYDVGGGTQDVAAGPNGQVAYVNPGGSPQTVGLLFPGGLPQPIESPASDPFGAVFGQDGAYWITRGNPYDLLRVTTDGQVSTPIVFAQSGNVGPRKIATGPGGTLWVTLDEPNKVGKVTGVEAPAPEPGTGPSTEIDKTPKKKLKAKDKKNGKKGLAKAKFKFSSSTSGVSFECSLRPKKKQPKFKDCESPAKYKLKPGKYKFEVRAVLAGVPDPSPETFAFKVVREKR